MSSGSGPGMRKFQFFQDILLIAAAQVSTYYLVRYILARFDPDSDQKEEAKQKAAASTAALRRLDGRRNGEQHLERREPTRPRKEDLVLSQYEQSIAMELVAPEDIPILCADIGGLEDIIEELKESVIYPLTLPHLYSQTSSLLSAPSGVLLYGPPGCGKTMLAKALAHESGACFINLHISTLTEKWYGDSNKLVNAVFSLARKLQPTIVFIDEIDAVLGTRRTSDHEASGMVKAEFMTHWDGLTSASASGSPSRILILGATNRIQDIDDAILRRMPKKFPVSLPTSQQRQRILSLVLKDTKLDTEHLDMHFLVSVMAGMSGSDIKEACRDAAMAPVREFIRSKRDAGEGIDGVDYELDVRGVRTEDFFGRKGGLQVLNDNVRDRIAERAAAGEDDDDDEDEELDSRAESYGEAVE
ncbi:MAG: hypothetical protein M1819_003179 [Sarea resinae]|nr:MAG: hypothetical protein M1819_003179 [Sarea resinae]